MFASKLKNDMIFDEIEYFANLCNETKRGHFTITKNVKTRMWRVRVNKKQFIDVSLAAAISKASKYVFCQRKLTTNRGYELQTTPRPSPED